jgi:hypothetical protein
MGDGVVVFFEFDDEYVLAAFGVASSPAAGGGERGSAPQKQPCDRVLGVGRADSAAAQPVGGLAADVTEGPVGELGDVERVDRDRRAWQGSLRAAW